MPIYVWRDEISGLEVEVVRSLAGSDIPPDTDEVGEVRADPPTRKWVKLLQTFTKHSAPGWGRKGEW